MPRNLSAAGHLEEESKEKRGVATRRVFVFRPVPEESVFLDLELGVYHIIGIRSGIR
jgi:hypothetical protein